MFRLQGKKEEELANGLVYIIFTDSNVCVPLNPPTLTNVEEGFRE